jgi:hypothetical protein
MRTLGYGAVTIQVANSTKLADENVLESALVKR